MTRIIYTSEDIKIWRECGEDHLELAPGDIVTLEARDVAKALGMALKDGPVEENLMQFNAVQPTRPVHGDNSRTRLTKATQCK